jgi:hypothetical protein
MSVRGRLDSLPNERHGFCSLRDACGGDLYVSSAGSGEVLRYDGQTGEFIEAFVPAGRGGITGPRVIAFKSTITVCHRPPGNPDESATLTIGYLVGREHVVGHGDTVGSCPAT